MTPDELKLLYDRFVQTDKNRSGRVEALEYFSLLNEPRSRTLESLFWLIGPGAHGRPVYDPEGHWIDKHFTFFPGDRELMAEVAVKYNHNPETRNGGGSNSQSRRTSALRSSRRSRLSRKRAAIAAATAAAAAGENFSPSVGVRSLADLPTSLDSPSMLVTSARSHKRPATASRPTKITVNKSSTSRGCEPEDSKSDSEARPPPTSRGVPMLKLRSVSGQSLAWSVVSTLAPQDLPHLMPSALLIDNDDIGIDFSEWLLSVFWFCFCTDDDIIERTCALSLSRC